MDEGITVGGRAHLKHASLATVGRHDHVDTRDLWWRCCYVMREDLGEEVDGPCRMFCVPLCLTVVHVHVLHVDLNRCHGFGNV
jgi:hypothetical protein